jgi:flavin reductase (DIM6/NTAB) family NADH-FMN oxidoreductase RutF
MEPSKTAMSQQQSKNPFTPYPPSKVYRLIEPGPVLLVSTGPPTKSKSKPQRDANSNDINVMTMGFHMMVQHSGPPLIAACIGSWDATYARLQATRECVLAVPSVEMAETVVDIGNCSMDDLESAQGPGNKFEKFGLEALPAAKVGAPLVGGEHVIGNVECVVEYDGMVDRYNLWVLRVVKAWVNEGKKLEEGGRMFHHRGDGTFSVDGEEVLDLRERMVKWKMFQD